MNWNEAAPAAIVGAVVATLGVFVVELWLKPAFSRRRAAVTLLVELRLNVRLIDRILEHRTAQPDAVSESIFMSQKAWDAVSDDIHYLREEELKPLLLTYAQFEELNNHVEAYSRHADLLLQAPPSPKVMILFQEAQENAKLFGRMLSDVRAQCIRTIARLERAVEDGPPMMTGGASGTNLDAGA